MDPSIETLFLFSFMEKSTVVGSADITAMEVLPPPSLASQTRKNDLDLNFSWKEGFRDTLNNFF